MLTASIPAGGHISHGKKATLEPQDYTVLNRILSFYQYWYEFRIG